MKTSSLILILLIIGLIILFYQCNFSSIDKKINGKEEKNISYKYIAEDYFKNYKQELIPLFEELKIMHPKLLLYVSDFEGERSFIDLGSGSPYTQELIDKHLPNTENLQNYTFPPTLHFLQKQEDLYSFAVFYIRDNKDFKEGVALGIYDMYKEAENKYFEKVGIEKSFEEFEYLYNFERGKLSNQYEYILFKEDSLKKDNPYKDY